MVLGLWLQLIRKKMVKGVEECMGYNASNSEIYGKMQLVFEMEATSNKSFLVLCKSLETNFIHELPDVFPLLKN